MTVKLYKHFKPEDRLKLYSLLLEGLAIQEIADALGYHKASVYRELSRNSSKLGYRPDIACQQYMARRRYNAGKIEKQSELHIHIIGKLKEGWSPQQIAGRLKMEHGYTIVSHEAIYQYIYSPAQKHLKLHQYLRKKRNYRYPRAKRRRQKPHNDKISIHERDDRINTRSQFGHWEGDLVLFRKTKTNLFTLRERKTRFLVAIKNANRQARSTSKSLISYMQDKVGISAVSTLTLDNDTAFREYKEIGEKLDAKVYFCDPYKSWQKGSIENGNGLMRETFTRDFSISQIDQNAVDEAISRFNNRPMRVLNFMTPAECFLQENLKAV
jgi:IS30 family transposase